MSGIGGIKSELTSIYAHTREDSTNFRYDSTIENYNNTNFCYDSRNFTIDSTNLQTISLCEG